MGSPIWRVDHVTGSASDVHARAVPDQIGPSVWVVTPTDRSIVLGSTQREAAVDHEAAERHGLVVARRRSGGGAVLVTPGSLVWVDVVLPRAHPDWTDDVGRASVWMGERWASALAGLGVDGRVLQPPMAADPLGRVVCFVGRGPGEIVIGDAKAVGISQRRTRDTARFQCAALLSWDRDPLIEVMGIEDGPDVARVRRAGIGLSVDPDRLVSALIDTLD